jgi:hypothetical protein
MEAAEVALRLGFGGISSVSRACGMSQLTITKAIGELDANLLAEGRIRRTGAGRRQLVLQDPVLLDKLEALVEPLKRGDPQLSELRPPMVKNEVTHHRRGGGSNGNRLRAWKLRLQKLADATGLSNRVPFSAVC